MKKALLYLCAFALMVGLFVSCEHPAAEAIVNQLVVDKDVQSPWGHAWFAGDAEYQFIDDNGTKYIRCLPDSLTDTYFIQVKSEDPESGTVEALVKYSRDSIRETGTPVKFTCSMTGYNLNFTADSSTLEKYKNLFTKLDWSVIKALMLQSQNFLQLKQNIFLPFQEITIFQKQKFLECSLMWEQKFRLKNQIVNTGLQALWT